MLEGWRLKLWLLLQHALMPSVEEKKTREFCSRAVS
jgi:hypothetical protein